LRYQVKTPYFCAKIRSEVFETSEVFSLTHPSSYLTQCFSPKATHLLYLAATIVTVLLIGYYFGTFDEAMHVPFLKASANPGLLIFMKESAVLTLTAFSQDDVVLVMIIK
jgi:hypothetical protein